MQNIEGSIGPYINAGAPVSGTNEVQTITPSAAPASGTFMLMFDGYKTTALAHNVSAAAMQTALNLLSSIGTGGVAVALDGVTGVYTITFSGANVAKRAQNMIIVANNTVKDAGNAAVTLTVAEGTPGVEATCLGAAAGALLIDTTNKTLYQNTGTAAAPTWSLIASGITVAAAIVNNLAQGVAAGYKIARGVAAVTGTATVATGLATVLAVDATAQSDLDGTTLAGVSATKGDKDGAPVAGSVILKCWKITAAGNAALIAADAEKSVNWVAIGT